MASPLAQFQGVDASTDQQKAALGAYIAQQGSQGVEAYKAQQAVAKAAIAPARASVTGSNPGIGNPAASSAVGPGRLTQELAARAAAPATLGFQQGGQAASEFDRYTGMLGQANANYMDAVKGAAPIVQSQTAAQIGQINAELAFKQRQMELQMKQDEEDRKFQLMQRGWAIQDRMLEEAANKKEAEGEKTPYGVDAAARSLGFKSQLTDQIRNSPAYNELYSYVFDNFKPGMDSTQIEGLMNAWVSAQKKQGNLTHDIPNTVALLKSQFEGLYGRALPAPPRTSTTSSSSNARAQAATNAFLGHGPGTRTADTGRAAGAAMGGAAAPASGNLTTGSLSDRINRLYAIMQQNAPGTDLWKRAKAELNRIS